MINKYRKNIDREILLSSVLTYLLETEIKKIRQESFKRPAFI